MRRNELTLLPKLPLLITEAADEFDVLKQVLRQPGQWEHHVEGEAQILAQSWFTDQEAKKQVSEILSGFDLVLGPRGARQDADLVGVTPQ